MATKLFGTVVVGCVALLARAAVMLWAGSRFPPAADGVYYDRIAQRIADGAGATWLWPDGAVTYVAHYPIGYSALLAAAYRLLWHSPAVGGWMNALFGTLGSLACLGLARRAMSERAARVAGLAVAIHPGLVLYTPALMTEGITAALIAIATWQAARTRETREQKRPFGLFGLGLIVGVATLVRPQVAVLAPWLGLLAASPEGGFRRRLRCAALTTAVALTVCLPWTLRNCVRMQQCGLSFNGGWNLLIGAGEKATGTWSPVDVPDECKTVWDEAAKDACFGRAAGRAILSAPRRWSGLVPAKLAATFDYSGAPGYYLHVSNGHVFGEDAKIAVGAIETIYERIAYGALLVCCARAAGMLKRTRMVLSAGGAVFLLFSTHAYAAALSVVVCLALLGRGLLDRPVLFGGAWGAMATTAFLHAVFFGSGRYSMVVFPLVTTMVPLAVIGLGALPRSWRSLRSAISNRTLGAGGL